MKPDFDACHSYMLHLLLVHGLAIAASVYLVIFADLLLA